MRNIRITFLIIGLCWFNVANSFAQMTADEAMSKFVTGGLAYKEGQYDVAIKKYNEVLQGGRVSGPLYYNLGNSYFKNDNLGKAILNYERAKRFIPRDSDLNFNYHYARSRADYYDNEEKLNFIERAIRGHIQFYTTDEMVIILACIGGAIGIIFLLLLYIGYSRPLSRGIIALLIFAFIGYVAGLAAKVYYEENLTVVVAASKSYFEPRIDSTVHFKLPEGGKVRILKFEGGWIKVRRLDGKIGWVSSEILEKI